MKKLPLVDKFAKTDGGTVKVAGMTLPQIGMIVVSLVLLGLGIYFGYDYFQEVKTKNDLADTVKTKEAQVAKMPIKNLSIINASLSDALAELATGSHFPAFANVSNVQVAYDIIQAAKDANIYCYQYAPDTTVGTTTLAGTTTYAEKSFSVSTSQGEKLFKVVNFLRNLEELDYETSYIDSLSLTSGDTGLWTFTLKYYVITQSAQ